MFWHPRLPTALEVRLLQCRAKQDNPLLCPVCWCSQHRAGPPGCQGNDISQNPQLPFLSTSLQHLIPQSVCTSRIALSSEQNPAPAQSWPCVKKNCLPYRAWYFSFINSVKLHMKLNWPKSSVLEKCLCVYFSCQILLFSQINFHEATSILEMCPSFSFFFRISTLSSTASQVSHVCSIGTDLTPYESSRTANLNLLQSRLWICLHNFQAWKWLKSQLPMKTEAIWIF